MVMAWSDVDFGWAFEFRRDDKSISDCCVEIAVFKMNMLIFGNKKPQ